MKINCDVISDLLPLYAEGMTTPASKELVEEHLRDCEECRKRAKVLSAPVPVVPELDDGMERVRREIVRRRWLAVGCAVLLLCTMLFAAANWLRQPIYLSSNVVESVGTDSNGSVIVTFSAEAAGTNSFKYDQQWCEDGTVVISTWTYRLEEWRTRDEEPRKITVHYDPRFAVGYFNAENGGNVENLYMPASVGQGMIILPRLYLSLYFMVALGLGAVLVLAAYILRRKGAGKWLWGFGSYLLCYALCQGFVCEFSFASFYAEQELFWALGMSVCLWGAGACAWKMWRKK